MKQKCLNLIHMGNKNAQTKKMKFKIKGGHLKILCRKSFKISTKIHDFPGYWLSQLIRLFGLISLLCKISSLSGSSSLVGHFCICIDSHWPSRQFNSLNFLYNNSSQSLFFCFDTNYFQKSQEHSFVLIGDSNHTQVLNI